MRAKRRGTLHGNPASAGGGRGSGPSAYTHRVRGLLAYLGGLTVTQGTGSGEKLKLLSWETRFVRGAFSTPGDAALSVARGNGKTALVSAIATAFLDYEPLRDRANRADVVVVASSFDQGRIAFEHVLAFLDALGHDLEDSSVWRVQDSSNRAVIQHRPSGLKLKCVGSDPRRAHGLAPVLVLADEGAQWPVGTAERMMAALRTSMGKIPGSRVIALGTRPDNPNHWFSRMLDGGASYSQIHAAPKDEPPGSNPPGRKRTWLKANPSLSFMPTLEAKLREEWVNAKSDPALMPAFKALRLNQGTPDTEQALLLDADTWARIERETAGAGDYALGLDLGSGAAMSAAAGYWPSARALEAVACFPELPGLEDREVKDGITGGLYRRMHERGELFIAGRRVASIQALLAEVLKRWGEPTVIVCDRWRLAELEDALEEMDFPMCGLVSRGMGFKDGAEDVRLFRKACLDDRVKPSKSLLLRSAMAEARVVTDPSANAKLAKQTQGGRRANARDDAVAAAILAVAEGMRKPDGDGDAAAGLRHAIAG